MTPPVYLNEHHAWVFVLRIEGALEKFPLFALFAEWPTCEQLTDTFRKHTLPWPTAETPLDKCLQVLGSRGIPEEYDATLPVNILTVGTREETVGQLEIRPVPVFDPNRKIGVFPHRYT